MSGRFTCCGVAIDAMTLDTTADWVLGRATAGTGGSVHLANAWSLATARRVPEHRGALREADLLVPDGMPLVWIARRLGLPMPGRVYGPELLDLVPDRGRSDGVRHLLYGGTPEVVATVAERLRERHPGVEIVAADSPPFAPVSEASVAALADRIEAVEAQVVWVALGTPRQDELLHRLRPRTDAVLVGVGAAFDFLAGAQRQAPLVLQRAGLEWAFRLVNHPRRLGRRYVLGNAVFLRDLMADPPHRLPDA